MGKVTPHDALFRGVFGDPGRAFQHLRGLLPPAVAALLDPSSVAPLPGSFVDGRLTGRQSDLLFQVRLAGSPALLYLLLEHQSTVDRRMASRLLRYMARIWERWEREHPRDHRLPPIVPLVLYHGSRPWCGPLRFADSLHAPVEVLAALAPHTPDFAILLQDLSKPSDEEMGGAAVVRLTLLLLRHAREPDLRQRLLCWTSLFREVACSSSWHELTMILEYILEVAESLQPRDLQDFFRDHVQVEASEVIMTLAEKLREEGRREGLEKGRQEGRQEGLEKGRWKGQQELLLRQMRLRFRQLPGEVVACIEAASPAELERWAERVLTAATPEEVVAG